MMRELDDYLYRLNFIDKKSKFNATYYKYCWIDGFELNKDCFREYQLVKKSIQYFCKNKSANGTLTLIQEMNDFKEVLINNRSLYKDDLWEKVNSSLYDLSYKIEENILKRNINYNYVCHADLHNKNILIDNSMKVKFIDYDEVSRFTKYYDLAIFIYRYLNSIPGCLSLRNYTLIKNELLKENIHFYEIIYYILKVIFQKKYLEITGETSLSQWKSDDWSLWYKDLSFILSMESVDI